MLRSKSWAKVSVVWVVAAAGTVLGTSAIASAQSARAERRVEVRVERHGEHEGARRVRVRPMEERHVERIIVRGDGEGGCDCGCPCCGGKEENEPSRFGEGAGPRARTFFGEIRGDRKAEVAGPIRGRVVEGKKGEVRARVVRPAPGSPEVRVQTFGKGVVIGPDGKRQEFRFGDGESGVFRLAPDGEGRHEIRLRRGGPEGGGGAPKAEPHRPQGRGHGGVPGVRGHVVIMGPDGESQVFDFGDDEAVSKVRVLRHRDLQEFRDGDGPVPHLFWRHGEDDRGAGRKREVEVRRLRKSTGVL